MPLYKWKVTQRNWVFAMNSNFLISISLQPDGVNLRYVNLRLIDLTEFIVWNISGLRHWVAKIKGLENQSMWQKLIFFCINSYFKQVKILTFHDNHKRKAQKKLAKENSWVWSKINFIKVPSFKDVNKNIVYNSFKVAVYETCVSFCELRSWLYFLLWNALHGRENFTETSPN